MYSYNNWNCATTKSSKEGIYMYVCPYVYCTCAHIQVNTLSYKGNGCPFVWPYSWRVNKDLQFYFWSLQVGFDAAGV